MAVAVLLCAQCGSHRVDVIGWRDASIGVLRCSSCDHESAVIGFTVGRIWRDDEPSIITSALEDAAMPVGVLR